MRDGVVSVNRQSDQYVSGRIRHNGLKESDEFTKDVARVPGYRYPPGDVRGDAN